MLVIIQIIYNISHRILVTYASRTATTAGVAEAIGRKLSDNGALVEVLPMEEVTDLAPYSTVVAGSAIRTGQWLPEAMAFVHAHQDILKTKTFAIFTVCMTLAMTRAKQYKAGVEEWVLPVRMLVKPVSEGYFAGRLDISQIRSLADRVKFRLSVWTGVWKEGDHRDWKSIEAWAGELMTLLKL
ncbi:MAG TPA: flavodoxin domain-containing protein [Bacteroidales bacterium]|nr:flavodoxin domain-containing protein [Bacteroidales bacterium]